MQAICLVLTSLVKFLFSSEDNDDYYSPTDWEQDPTESDADYEERTEDLNDWLDYNN